MKPKIMKLEKDAETKAKEAKDSAAFKTILAKAKSEVNNAENAISALTRQVTPMVAKPPEEGEAADKRVEGIETGAVDALKKVETARTELNDKFKAIQAYAPEAKKTA